MAPNMTAQLSISVLPTSSSCVPVILSSASVLPTSICEMSQRSKSNSGLVYFVVPGKCDIPPLATMATRSFRPFTISAIALPTPRRCEALGRAIAEIVKGRKERVAIDIGEERDDGNVALPDQELERDREGVAELRVLGICHVEVVIHDQLVEDVLRHLAMDRQVVLAAGELGDGAAAGDDREAGDAGDGEGLDVVGAEHQDDVGLALVQRLAQFLDRRGGLIELLGVLVRRPGKQIRSMAGAQCGNDLTHCSLLRFISSPCLFCPVTPSSAPRWRRSIPARDLRGRRRRTRCPGGRTRRYCRRTPRRCPRCRSSSPDRPCTSPLRRYSGRSRRTGPCY